MTKKRAESRRELKKKAVDFKGGACEACGYNKCLAALTFHHRNPSEKRFTISDVLNLVSWKQIKRELTHCVMLCTNCHTEVHEGLLDGYIDNNLKNK